LIVYSQTGGGMRKVWCENCGMQGHKHYECPEKLLSTNADVFCEICHLTTHPTNDCPKRGEKKKGFLAIEDNPDEELHRFLKEVKEQKKTEGP
jgi:hypothetical protein